MKLRLALICAFVLLAGSAQAQINPFKGNNGAPRLADSDLPLMDEARQKLLGDEAPAVGTSEAWKNEATGDSGTVTYLGPTKRTVAGTTYDCRRVKYSIMLKVRKTPRTARVAWCHLPDGSWKMN